MQSLPPALSALAAWPQFVVWYAYPHPTKAGKFNKFPANWATGDVVDAQDPKNWTTAANALMLASTHDRGYGSGVGFVFTEADPFFFHDIDGALIPADPLTGAPAQWSPLAQELVARFPGAAGEVSHSGKGLHIFGRTAMIPHACKNTPLGLELYTSGRFAALTLSQTWGDVVTDCTGPVSALIAQYFPPSATGDFVGWTSEAGLNYSGSEDDEELIRKMLASRPRSAAAAFGSTDQPTFADLWEVNVDVLAKRWPGEGSKPFGQSEADQSLANLLAFWTGKNCERMERLMRRSGLARPKYDTHRSYLGDTILKACAYVANILTTGGPTTAPVVDVPAPEVLEAAASQANRKLRDATQEYMGPHLQLPYFDGCFFDNMTGRIYSLMRNTEFTKATFDVNYGGHMFVLDPASAKTTDSAWDAYTKSRVNVPVIVDGLCFRPEKPPGAIIVDGNRIYANSYVPHVPVTRPGDVTPFLNLMDKLLPDPGDREAFMGYIASLAQNPGRKFQWWPVLQGVKGNGKTFIVKALTYIMGQEYTHLPNAAAMAKDGIKFNAWIYRKLFIAVEEIAVSHRRDFLEEFKPVVTNERIPVEKKGQDQFTGDNRVNGILCTNHKDGVPITVDERRYGIFYTAQQTKEDLARDGMTAEYFVDLYDWFHGRGAYATQGEYFGASVIAGYLLTAPIAAHLDPAKLATTAPGTTSTAEALLASLGRAEQEIMDAVDEGRPGFAGGWVSSIFVQNLFDQIRVNIPKNKLPELMRTLGYHFHPSLRDGRTNDVVAPDARKPRLYVKIGSMHEQITSPVDIGRAYSRAQEPTPASGVNSAAVLAFGPKPV